MKRIFLVMMILFVGFASLYSANYAKAQMKAARKVIKRTAVVLIAAHQTVKKGKVYTGDLARAVRHQKFAKILFARRNYERSIRQSLRARQLAYMAMKANRKTVREDVSRDEREFYLSMKSSDLDEETTREMAQDKYNDEDIVKLNIQVDVSE